MPWSWVQKADNNSEWLSAKIKEWTIQQETWKQQLLLEPEDLSSTVDMERLFETFPMIGGLDITPDKEQDDIAYVGIVVLSSKSLQVKYCQTHCVKLQVPYVPGFLGFREAPALINAVECLKREKVDCFPQVLLVDGNGILHPRGFGSACQVGLSLNLPTIGVAKSLLSVDGLNTLQIKEQICEEGKRWLPLLGSSNRVLGAALLSNECVKRPIFVSVGYRIKLLEAINLVFHTCRYRIPEPIRIADKISRQASSRDFC
ncbi:deoxyribonuclease V [Galdieria sulphuraria]|uniref:Deoxyribonuclease V n=1 Tax=Galdieria sulphuraria TaxID=130081 RepID=M2Y2Q7_GALSU|nr:deoxyribonuclease V [Galdieria sulphuraria]EME30228.1 deoxyribonuclease V [Galdieria sulphuraria]|eukprot:XP_005706748.1 deoxyribonuclease V [Galdieria sulphuraria]